MFAEVHPSNKLPIKQEGNVSDSGKSPPASVALADNQSGDGQPDSKANRLGALANLCERGCPEEAALCHALENTTGKEHKKLYATLLKSAKQKEDQRKLAR